MCSIVDSIRRPLALQPIVIVAMQTGMRLGEILALHWRHIDFEQKTLTIEGSITSTKERGTFVKDTKTEAGERVIALSDFTCDTLRKVRLRRTSVICRFNIVQTTQSFSTVGR